MNTPTNEVQNKSLCIASRTWSRDSHGLYDYECAQTKNSNLTIKSEHLLIRRKNDVRLENSNYQEEQTEEFLGKVYVDSLNRHFLSNPINYRMNPNEENINSLQNKIWYIIKSEELSNNSANQQQTQQQIVNENGFAELKLNDIVKLGRVKYAITEIKINGVKASIDQANIEHQVFNLIPDYNKQTVSSNMDGVLCKICLTNNEEEGNPLINLCRCSGSMEFIHYSCVKMWMNTKLSNKVNESQTVFSYNMKSFNCEICKTPYPLRFRYNNSFYEIIECARPLSSNYIVLESLNQLKDNNNYKSIHVITLNENDRIVMGRGHDSDVRINDISVSRTHSCLTLSNKKILLKDLRSKFGTLVLIQGELEITSDKRMSLQIGRSYFETAFAMNKDQKTKEKNSSSVQNNLNLNLNKSNNSANFPSKKQIFQVEKYEKVNSPKNKDEMDID